MVLHVDFVVVATTPRLGNSGGSGQGALGRWSRGLASFSVVSSPCCTAGTPVGHWMIDLHIAPHLFLVATTVDPH